MKVLIWELCLYYLVAMVLENNILLSEETFNNYSYSDVNPASSKATGLLRYAHKNSSNSNVVGVINHFPVALKCPL